MPIATQVERTLAGQVLLWRPARTELSHEQIISALGAAHSAGLGNFHADVEWQPADTGYWFWLTVNTESCDQVIWRYDQADRRLNTGSLPSAEEVILGIPWLTSKIRGLQFVTRTRVNPGESHQVLMVLRYYPHNQSTETPYWELGPNVVGELSQAGNESFLPRVERVSV